MVSLSIKLCGLGFLSKLTRVSFFLFLSFFYIEFSQALQKSSKYLEDSSTGYVIGNNDNIRLYPLLKLDYGYTSNVNSHPQNGDGAIGFRVKPSFSLVSDFYPHSIKADASFSHGFYLGTSQKQGLKGNFDIFAKFEISDGFFIKPLLGVGVEYETLAQGDLPQNTADNVRKVHLQSGVALSKEFGRVTTSTGFYYISYDFRDAMTTAGDLIEQDPRDVQIFNGIFRLDYKLNKKLEIFTQFSHERFLHPNNSVFNIDLNFSKNTLLFGARVELSDIITGYVALGYSRADYKYHLAGKVDAIVYRVNLKYKPSPRVQTSITADSTITNTTIVRSLSKKVNNFSLQTDYSFGKDITLSPNIAYQLNNYKHSTSSDKKYTVGMLASYNLLPGVVLGFDYNFTKADYSLNEFNYSSHYLGSFIEFSY